MTYKIGGLILSGGLATRMGGADKGLTSLNQRYFIEYALDQLKDKVDFLAISANRHLDQYRAYSYDVFPDEAVATKKGPLGGIYSALKHFPKAIDAIQIIPCDTPFLPHDLVYKMTDVLFSQDNLDIVYAATDVAPHWSILQFKTSAFASLESRLHQNRLSLHSWVKSLNHAHVHFDDDGLFANINDIATLKQYDTHKE